MSSVNFGAWSHEDLVREIERLSDRTKFGLYWEEKPENVALALNEKIPLLTHVASKAILKNSETATCNVLIEGDNLNALSALTFTHKGMIDLIYIDPPYNTGNKDFKYNDDYVDVEDSYRHSKWLSFMAKRIKLAKELLADDGMFFCSIDDNEVGPLRLLLDDIFLEKNFINCISVKTKSSAGASGGGEDKKLKKNVEYLLFYAKDKSKFNFNTLYVNTPLEEVISQKEDEGKSFEYTKVLLSSGDKKPFKTVKDGSGNDIKIFKHKGYEIRSVAELMASHNMSRENIYLKYFEKIYRTTNAQTSIRTRVADATGEHDGLFSIEYSPRSGKSRGKMSTSFYLGKKTDLFVWLADTAEKRKNTILKREKLGTLWADLSWNGIAKEGDVKFENGKKPVAFLQRILQLHPKRDIVVLDFFAGSGSLGHAVLEQNAADGQNRTFILATNNETSKKLPKGVCTEVTYPRLKNVIEGKGIKTGLKSNLRFLKTAMVDAVETDSNKLNLSRSAVGLLCLKEGCYEPIIKKDDFHVYSNSNKWFGIIYRESALEAFREMCRSTDLPINVYVFSLGDDAAPNEFSEFGGRVSTCAIPKIILNSYRRSKLWMDAR